MATQILCLGNSTFSVTLTPTGDKIHTTVTSSGGRVGAWISTVLFIHRRHLQLHGLIVGLGTAWALHPIPHCQNPIALLQLCVGRRCLVFQLLHRDFIPLALTALFANDRITFVGVCVEERLGRLRYDHGLHTAAAYAEDLRDLAAEETREWALRRAGLMTLVRRVMGIQVDIDRSMPRSRWDNAMLTMGQVTYATVNAFLSFEVGRRLFFGDWES